MTTNCSLLLRSSFCAFLVGISAACGGGSGSGDAASDVIAQRISLPDALREVSGLTVSADGELLAIADEVGVVFGIDFAGVKVSRYASFGDPPERDDFEGLAVRDGRLYALTSTGRIYRQSESAAGYERLKSGLRKDCEFEGLAADPQSSQLWLLCKHTLRKRYRGDLVIFAWDTLSGETLEGPVVQRDYDKLGFKKSISPSGLSFNADGSEITIIAARERAFLVIDRNGQVLRRGRLPAGKAHAQAEGIAVVGAAVYIADEGVNGKATLTLYPDGI